MDLSDGSGGGFGVEAGGTAAVEELLVAAPAGGGNGGGTGGGGGGGTVRRTAAQAVEDRVADPGRFRRKLYQPRLLWPDAEDV